MTYWTILDAAGAPVVMQVEADAEPDPAIYGGASVVALAGPVDPAITVWDGSAWTPDLPVLKVLKGEAIKTKRNSVEQAGCVTPYGRIDTDPDSQRKIGGASTMALALAAQFTMDWRMADNSIVTLNASQMIEVGVAVAQHVAACQANKNALDVAVQAATSVADLDAIDIEAGWPG